MKQIRIIFITICTGFFITFTLAAYPLQQDQRNTSISIGISQAVTGDRPEVEYLNPDGQSNMPFSDAVRVGNFLILSGKVGKDSTGKVVPGGIKAETKQTMENIRHSLEAAGSSLDEVVKCTVMLANMDEWGDVNEVYVTYFNKDRMPARSALGSNGLALGALIEIECWAVMNQSK